MIVNHALNCAEWTTSRVQSTNSGNGDTVIIMVIIVLNDHMNLLINLLINDIFNTMLRIQNIRKPSWKLMIKSLQEQIDGYKLVAFNIP